MGFSQETSSQEDAVIEVMDLGSPYFGNPKEDVINLEFPDVKQPRCFAILLNHLKI